MLLTGDASGVARISASRIFERAQPEQFHAHQGRNTALAARRTGHRPEPRLAEHEVKDSPMANLLRRIGVGLPINQAPWLAPRRQPQWRW